MEDIVSWSIKSNHVHHILADGKVVTTLLTLEEAELLLNAIKEIENKLR